MLNWLRAAPAPSLPAGRRVYAIGDIHGRFDLFDRLLRALEADNAEREDCEVDLVLLGDLIDRGPQSREVVTRAREGVEWARTIAIMGNHEAVMLNVLDGDTEQLRDWLSFGGRETLTSWGISGERIDGATLDDLRQMIRAAVTSEERRWISRMRPFVKVGDYYFVHAGIRPGVALEVQADHDRMWIRDDFLSSRKKHGAMIVHGHTITEAVEQRSNRIGLDTGAYATNRLTAIGLQRTDRWFLSTAD